MSNDHPIEIKAPPIAVAETAWVFRLMPREGQGRYTAIVAAESEAEARRFASEADPFGADWLNLKKFECELCNDLQHHLVGDVVFQSSPMKRKLSSDKHKNMGKAAFARVVTNAKRRDF
jgi:hypothetical protein